MTPMEQAATISFPITQRVGNGGARATTNSVPPLLPVPTHFGVMLRTYREARGWSLRELETRTGIDHVTLSRIEQGKDCLASHWLLLQAWLFQSAAF